MGRKAQVQRSAEEKFAIAVEGLKRGNIAETCRSHVWGSDEWEEFPGNLCMSPYLDGMATVRELSRLVSLACARVAESAGTTSGHDQSKFAAVDEKLTRDSFEHASSASAVMTEWEEIGVELAVRVPEIARGGEPNWGSLPATEGRVTRIVRMIESRPHAKHELGALARETPVHHFEPLKGGTQEIPELKIGDLPGPRPLSYASQGLASGEPSARVRVEQVHRRKPEQALHGGDRDHLTKHQHATCRIIGVAHGVGKTSLSFKTRKSTDEIIQRTRSFNGRDH